MKALIMTFSLLLSLGVYGSCPIDFSANGLCAELTWLDGPNLDKKSHFKLTFWDSEDQEQTPVSPEYDVNIYAWMTMHNGHNHGGPAMTYTEVEPGVFEVKDARFFMGRMRGFWEVRTDLSSEGTVLATGASRVEF